MRINDKLMQAMNCHHVKLITLRILQLFLQRQSTKRMAVIVIVCAI